MKAVVFAYHDMGITGLNAVLRAGFNIQAIFTHDDNPAENCWFASVKDWGAERDIPTYRPESVNSPEWVLKIRGLEPDVIFSFYYRNLLNDEILQIPAAGAFNLHGSLLPAYRGRVPVNWVLVNGETETGVTLHYMVKRADAGDIVSQRRVSIEFEDTAHSLFKKLLQAADSLLEETLPMIIAGQTPRIKQDLGKGSYFGRRRPEDGRIDWQWPAIRIYNLIRAVTEPYPGAFCYSPDGQKLIIWWAVPDRIEKQQGVVKPGTIINESDKVLVKAADGWLQLADIAITERRLTGESIINCFKTGDVLI